MCPRPSYYSDAAFVVQSDANDWQGEWIEEENVSLRSDHPVATIVTYLETGGPNVDGDGNGTSKPALCGYSMTELGSSIDFRIVGQDSIREEDIAEGVRGERPAYRFQWSQQDPNKGCLFNG